jgi:hypothetical protein
MTMSTVATSLVLLWVLLCFGIVGICVPLAALGGVAGSRRRLVLNVGPALMCTWLTLAIGVPLAAAVDGFNWVTAIVLAAVCPVGLWLCRHRGAYKARFRRMVRAVVMDVITLRIVRPSHLDNRRWIGVIAGASLLLMWALVNGGRDVRLPVAADFDVLWRTRQLLAGAAAWDPLAALAAVLTRISSANPLHVTRAIRLALVALTGLTAAVLITELGGWPRTIVMAVASLALPLIVPHFAAAAWAVALAALAGATSLLLWTRDRRARDAWCAATAFVLAAGQVLPFIGNVDVLVRADATAQYLEPRAAVREALRLDRTGSDTDWLLVGPPEQQLEIENGRFYDLARFVSRFRDRTGDPGFRFDLGAERIYVFVETQPFEARAIAFEGEFVAAQPVAYRVPRERYRLFQLARQICDEYRRTHAGTAVIYDDGELRVYQIDR